MRISDWSSDVCSSDLQGQLGSLQPDQADLAAVGQHHRVAVDDLGHAPTVLPGEAGGDLRCRADRGGRGGKQEEAQRQRLNGDPITSEERRVGTECVNTCRSRGSTFNYKKQKDN